MAGVLFLAAALCMCPAPGVLLLAILIHECGHLLCAFFLDWQRPHIQFSPAGIVLQYSGMHPPGQEILVCLAGSAVNFITAGVDFCCRNFSIIGESALFNEMLFFYSIGLGAVNLLPIQGMDGGGILNGVCSQFFLPDRAYQICRAGSVLSVLFLWGINLYIQMKIGFNLSLLAVSLYLTVTVLPHSA